MRALSCCMLYQLSYTIILNKPYCLGCLQEKSVFLFIFLETKDFKRDLVFFINMELPYIIFWQDSNIKI